MRKEIWSPDIWQRTMIQAWEESGRKNDLDLAREKIDHLQNEKKASSETFLSQAEERQILDLIKHAKTKLSA